MTPRVLWTILREACWKSISDRVPRLGAALAFYMTFSLAPLLLVVVAITGVAFGRQAAEGRLLSELRSLVGDEAATTLQSLIAAAGRQGSGVMASLVGGIVILVGAIGLFGELQDALNTVFEVQPKANGGVWSLVRSRLLSFLLVLGSAFLLLASLVFSTVVSAVSGMLNGTESGLLANSFLTHVLPTCVSFAVITILFAMIHRFLPDARIAWSDVWFGSIVTSLLFAIGKSLFSFYLGQAAITSPYGAAASLVVLMLWNYYTAQIFLFGAELTRAYARHCGTGIVPGPNAEFVPCADNVRSAPQAVSTPAA